MGPDQRDRLQRIAMALAYADGWNDASGEAHNSTDFAILYVNASQRGAVPALRDAHRMFREGLPISHAASGL